MGSSAPGDLGPSLRVCAIGEGIFQVEGSCSCKAEHLVLSERGCAAVERRKHGEEQEPEESSWRRSPPWRPPSA
jgi:hypothetical protein